MSDTSRKMIIGSMAASALVALAAVADLVTGFPFGGGSNLAMIMDILFLISSGIVLYLGWDSLQDLR